MPPASSFAPSSPVSRVTRVKEKSNYITPLFKQLHWLPNTFQVTPKLPSSPGPSHQTCLLLWLHLAPLTLHTLHGSCMALASLPSSQSLSFTHSSTPPWDAPIWSAPPSSEVSALMTPPQRSLAQQLHVPLARSPLSINTPSTLSHSFMALKIFVIMGICWAILVCFPH